MSLIVLDLVSKVLSPYLGSAIDTFSSAATFGTAAHNSLENELKLPLLSLKPYPQVNLDAEVFFHKPDSNGRPNPSGRREKGSIGIDILVSYKGEPVLGLDLKTGRGASNTRNSKLKKRIGADIIEIHLEFFDE